MLGRGVIVIPSAVRSRGPWLDATPVTSLQRVANRPIVCHVLDALLAAGTIETAVLVPAELLQEVMTCIDSDGPPGANVRHVVYDSDAGPAGALGTIAGFAGDAPTIVHRADGLLGQPLGPFLDLLRNDRSDMVLLVVQGARNAERLGPAAHRALRLTEIDPANAELGLAGACVLGPGVLERLRPAEPCLHDLELAAMAESLIARDGGRLQVRVVRDWRAFTGDRLDLLDMNRSVLDGLEQEASVPRRDGNRFEGPVLVDATASVASSVICGPVIVGAGARIADSYVGPHTSIGERARLEGAEIEHSIVFAGASILHVSGRLVASVVGRDARVFRDFSVPRAMRIRVGDNDEVALC